MKNIATKMLKITAEMGALPKNGINAHFGYPYVREVDAMDRFRDLCIANRLVVIPSLLDAPERDGSITDLVMSYQLIDIDSGETFTIHMPGSGQDSGDKGVFKAITGAYKYFILKTFQVGTDADPETADAIHAPAKQTTVDTSTSQLPSPAPIEEDKSSWWASEYNGKRYLNAKEGRHFNQAQLLAMGFRKGKRPGFYNAFYSSDLEQKLQKMTDIQF